MITVRTLRPTQFMISRCVMDFSDWKTIYQTTYNNYYWWSWAVSEDNQFTYAGPSYGYGKFHALGGFKLRVMHRDINFNLQAINTVYKSLDFVLGVVRHDVVISAMPGVSEPITAAGDMTEGVW